MSLASPDRSRATASLPIRSEMGLNIGGGKLGCKAGDISNYTNNLTAQVPNVNAS